MQKKLSLSGIAAVTAVAMACGEKAATPVSPSPTASTAADAAADGSTLKATAPAPQQPANGSTIDSHVTYTLQRTLTSGSIEFLVEGLESDSNGGKTKVVSMQQAYSDITDNPYRFNVEKRGDDHPDVGKYRMRIITGHAIGGFWDSERIVPSSTLVASKVYHHRVTWSGGVVSLTVKEGSSKGPVVVNHQYSYQGTHRPSCCTAPRGVAAMRARPLFAVSPSGRGSVFPGVSAPRQ